MYKTNAINHIEPQSLNDPDYNHNPYDIKYI